MKTIIITILLISTLFAELKIGDTFPTIPLIDQFDKKIELPMKGSTVVMVSFEKEVSKAINAFLESKDKAFLKENNITYISDISTVPSFLMNWIVLPKLKKLSFSVALIYGEEGEHLNHQEGKVSVFRVKDAQVVDIKFLEATELEKNKL